MRNITSPYIGWVLVLLCSPIDSSRTNQSLRRSPDSFFFLNGCLVCFKLFCFMSLVNEELKQNSLIILSEDTVYFFKLFLLIAVVLLTHGVLVGNFLIIHPLNNLSLPNEKNKCMIRYLNDGSLFQRMLTQFFFLHPFGNSKQIHFFFSEIRIFSYVLLAPSFLFLT